MGKQGESDNTANTDKRTKLPQLWKKGQSGNPSGRPKGSTLLTDLTTELNKLYRIPDSNKVITKKKAVISALVDMAIAGDMKAQTIIWERLHGRVPLPLQGTDESPIKITIVND